MIGIFGDSYAHEHVTIGWPTFLSELYNEEIENFARDHPLARDERRLYTLY